MPEDPRNDEPQDVIEATAEDVEISDPGTSDSSPARGWLRRWPLITLLVLIVLIAAVAAVVVVRPELVLRALGTSEPASAEQIAALEKANQKSASEIASLRTRVIALAGRVETLGASDEVATRVAALEKKVESLANAPATATAPAADTEARAQLSALAERLAALETARATSTSTPAPAAATADQFAAAAERIKALQNAIVARDRALAALRSDNERLVQSVGGLAQRLAKLEQAGAARGGVPSKTAALVLAAGQLRAALARRGPYAEELSALEALAGDDEIVKKNIGELRPKATTGIATRRMLAAQFDAMARAVIQAAVASDDPGWVDRALARLAGVVTIRPTGGDVEGDSPSAILARAEARLKTGDLQGAVEQLGSLDGASAKAASGWLDDARARLAADRAASALNRHVIGVMARTVPEATTSPAE